MGNSFANLHSGSWEPQPIITTNVFGNWIAWEQFKTIICKREARCLIPVEFLNSKKMF